MDNWTDPAVVASLLGGRQLAVAESLTCGRLARAFAETEGSTEWFRGGLTAWQHETKYRLLGLGEGSPVVSALHLLAEHLRSIDGDGAAADPAATVATVDDLPDELQSRVMAATGHANVRLIRRFRRPGGDRYELHALTGDRVMTMALWLGPDQSVAEATDTCLLAEITAVQPEGEAWALTVARTAGPVTMLVPTVIADAIRDRR